MVAALAGIARADSKPDPAAEEKASEANLKSNAPREGVTISAVLGGATFVGIGTQNAVGRGAAVSVRLGHVATPHTIITFEANAMNMAHEIAKTVYLNTQAAALVGAQVYTSPSLWLRGAGGLAAFGRTGADPTMNSTLVGPAALFGIGVDILRRHFFTLDLQLASIAMVNSEGVLVTGSLGLGVNYY